VDKLFKLQTSCWLQLLVFQGFQFVGKYKFNEIYINTRMTRLQMGFQIMIIMNVIFYDALDNWWHQNGNVIKHVNAFTNDIDEVIGNPIYYYILIIFLT
jgi:hypothetical protein